ncbi:MAG TPA: VOC family protein [Candidatus Omnitrophota bacterium]|nr:glyoxalase [Candidatus Omnitrophota bacterium]HRK62556.1 VOC family protein [Candidatus Omnitrophota bacterium]
MKRPIFHLAFPVKDVESTTSYYRDKLGFRIDLVEPERCIIDFFGHQAVAHVSLKDVPARVSMYPRHFGVILDDEKQFDEFHARLTASNADFFQRLFVRFQGTPREHKTFFLKDPSNNLIEFKWYRDPSLVFKSHPDSPPLSH